MTVQEPTDAGALLSAPRASILDHVRRQPGITVAELEERCGIHRNTVTRHLEALGAAGLVERFTESAGRRGRPQGRYRAAEHCDTAGVYAALAGRLASRLGEGEGGLADARRLGQAWGRELGAQERDVVAVLRDLGFEPEVDADGHAMRLHECPLLPDGEEDPAVCTMHVASIRALLEARGLDVRDLSVRPFHCAGSCSLHVGPDSL